MTTQRNPVIAGIELAIARHALLGAGETVVVGVSGGVDSLVLLHALHSVGRWPLHVATLDHRTRGAASAADADFVRQTATMWGLPVTIGRADVPAAARAYGLNPEEAARQVRYAFLLRVARQIGAAKIAVGHHQDDQAETILMHLIRGSGLDGLRGMLPVVSLSAFALPDDPPLVIDPPFDRPALTPEAWPLLIRPLLDVPRQDIEACAAEHNLQPRHDETNEDLTYFRNRLRHEVIPLLAELNPNIRAALARTAAVVRDDAAFVQRAGEIALQRAIVEDRPGAVTLDRALWQTFSASEKRSALRALIVRLRPERRDVEFEHVENAIRIAETGTTGAMVDLPGGLTLRVEYVTLVVGAAGTPLEMNAPALPPGAEPRVFTAGESIRWEFGAWVFEAGPFERGGEWDESLSNRLATVLAVPADSRLTLRTRRPGDRFQPNALGGHSQKLSDTLINMKVPRAWRDRVPLLFVEDRLAWFVAPTPSGALRARVAEPFMLRGWDPTSNATFIKVRWKNANR